MPNLSQLGTSASSSSPQQQRVWRNTSSNQLSPHSIRRHHQGGNANDSSSGTSTYQKKGWLLLWHASSKEWSKHWFVLWGSSLYYYQDIQAEEEGKLDGTISLATCSQVKEYHLEKNSGFRIYTHEGAVQLAALTDNIRLSWIQAIQDLIKKHEEHQSGGNHRRGGGGGDRLHFRTAMTTTTTSGTNQNSGAGSDVTRRTPSPARSPASRRGGVAEANLNEAAEYDLQPLGPSAAARSPPTKAANDKFEQAKEPTSRNAAGKSSLEVSHLNNTNTRRKPHIGTLSEQQSQISVSKSANNLRDVTMPAKSSSSHSHIKISPREFENDSSAGPGYFSSTAYIKTRDTSNVPLASLDTMSTTFQMSSGGEDHSGTLEGHQSSSNSNIEKNTPSRLTVKADRSADASPIERRPLRRSPREEEVLRLRLQVKKLTSTNADLTSQISTLKSISLSQPKEMTLRRSFDHTGVQTDDLREMLPSQLSHLSLSRKTSDTAKLQIQVKELSSSKESLSKRVEILTSSRNEQLSEIAALQDKLEETQKSLRAVKSQGRSPVGRLRQLQQNQTNDESDQSLDLPSKADLSPRTSSSSQGTRSYVDIECLKRDLAGYKTSNERLARQLDVEIKRNAELESRSWRNDDVIRNKESSIATLREELSCSERKIKSLQDKMNSSLLARRRNDTPDSAQACQDKSHNQLSIKLVAAEQSLEILQHSYDQDINARKEIIESMQKDKEILDDRCCRLRSEAETAKNETEKEKNKCAESFNKLHEALEQVEMMEKKAAIERLRIKKSETKFTGERAKLIRENAKFANKFEKLDKEYQTMVTENDTLKAENEKVLRQKKDLEHFMERRLTEMQSKGNSSKAGYHKAIQVALPTAYEQSMEHQVFDLKTSFENEKDFFKRIGELFPDLSYYSNSELLKVFRKKLLELKTLRDRAKVLEIQILRWDNPRETPQACVNEFVVTSYRLAAVEYTCGLLKQQLDADAGEEMDNNINGGSRNLQLSAIPVGVRRRIETPLVRWSSSELSKQLAALEKCLDLETARFPLATKRLLDKCTENLKQLLNCNISCQCSQIPTKPNFVANENSINTSCCRDLRRTSTNLLKEIIRELTTERKNLCDVITSCSSSVEFAESLTVDLIHILSSTKTSFNQLARQIDKHVQLKQKQMPIDDVITTAVSNLEISLDTIASETPSSALLRLRQTLQNLNQTLVSMATSDVNMKCDSEHSVTAGVAGGDQPSLSSPGSVISDNITSMCTNLLNFILPEESLRPICDNPINHCLDHMPKDATKPQVNNRNKNPTFNLVGGADVIVSTCHLLVCGAVSTALNSQKQHSRSVNWSQGHAVIADIETELDKKIEQHLDLIETLTSKLPESINSNCSDLESIFEMAERLNWIFENHRLKHSQCMSVLYQKLSVQSNCDTLLCRVAQFLSSSSDLRNAGSYQKWLNVEIDNSLLRVQNLQMQILLHNINNIPGSRNDRADCFQKVKTWCEEHPVENSELFLDPDVEKSLFGLSTNSDCKIRSLRENPDTSDRFEDVSSLINYIILKAFICSSSSANQNAELHKDTHEFQVTLLPTVLTSLDYSSFSSLILTSAIYLNQLQSLLTRLGKNFPKELKMLRAHIKSSGQNMEQLSKQYNNAEKFLNVLSNSEITSTLQKIADGYTRQFKKQREKYVKGVMKLQQMMETGELGSPSNRDEEGPVIDNERKGNFICSVCSQKRATVIEIKALESKTLNDSAIKGGASVGCLDFGTLPNEGEALTPEQEQLQHDLIQTLESVNCYSQYISKLLHPDVEFVNRSPNLPIVPRERGKGGMEGVLSAPVADPFAEQHNIYIAHKLSSLEKRWSQLAESIENNINIKTTACCEELFRGAFDIGLLILFAHRVGIPVNEEAFVNKFSEELQAIKELYDEAVDRTVTKCESIIFRYNSLCQQEVERLKVVFNDVIESDSLIQELEDQRLASMDQFDTVFSSISFLHFNPEIIQTLKDVYDDQMKLVKQELQCVSNKLAAKSLKVTTLEDDVNKLNEELDSVTNRSKVLEEELKLYTSLYSQSSNISRN